MVFISKNSEGGGQRMRGHGAREHLLLRRRQSDHLDTLDCVAVETWTRIHRKALDVELYIKMINEEEHQVIADIDHDITQVPLQLPAVVDLGGVVRSEITLWYSKIFISVDVVSGRIDVTVVPVDGVQVCMVHDFVLNVVQFPLQLVRCERVLRASLAEHLGGRERVRAAVEELGPHGGVDRRAHHRRRQLTVLDQQLYHVVHVFVAIVQRGHRHRRRRRRRRHDGAFGFVMRRRQDRDGDHFDTVQDVIGSFGRGDVGGVGGGGGLGDGEEAHETVGGGVGRGGEHVARWRGRRGRRRRGLLQRVQLRAQLRHAQVRLQQTAALVGGGRARRLAPYRLQLQPRRLQLALELLDLAPLRLHDVLGRLGLRARLRRGNGRDRRDGGDRGDGGGRARRLLLVDQERAQPADELRLGAGDAQVAALALGAQRAGMAASGAGGGGGGGGAEYSDESDATDAEEVAGDAGISCSNSCCCCRSSSYGVSVESGGEGALCAFGGPLYSWNLNRALGCCCLCLVFLRFLSALPGAGCWTVAAGVVGAAGAGVAGEGAGESRQGGEGEGEMSSGGPQRGLTPGVCACRQAASDDGQRWPAANWLAFVYSHGARTGVGNSDQQPDM
ncbi:hypothetical protein MSG28_005107 [Choristoneura fumiferana]|uniref:Uncharacterized protein n=1 Tax=Choristoneura fumiferana TaxID=7141 RepID=A0ACC0JPZ8_CHOFU|nr:hypothetical protein MSG28_005107 [Choristoneura fumiferana]